LDTKHSIGDRLQLRIERIVPRGLGIAFADGMTFFVALATTGDLVDARVVEAKGRTAFAEIESVIEPGPDRIEPPCPYFGTCGGCDFQQLNYEAQLAAKVAMIRDCLHRIGKIEWEKDIPIIPSPEPFGYRLRAQWHANTNSKQIGYFRRDSRDLVDIEYCMVLQPELQSQLTDLRESSSWKMFASEKAQIDAAVGSSGEASVYSAELTDEPREISIKAFDEEFIFSARSFFQGNKYLLDNLVEAAMGDASGENAIDLYCGVGFFTLPLARRFGHVIGVEENGEAVEFAERNAMSAGIGNAEFRADNVRRYLSNVVEWELDLVLLDPPRAGTEKETIMNLIRLRPKQVSYVACEPSVLARDLKRFVENGYAIASITALDMFPQTHHVETVVKLGRSDRM
jgi:23S rRNA (uracil1939-C5)-methyltransferase